MVAWDAADDPMLAAEALLAWMYPAERAALATRALQALEPAAAAAICEPFQAEQRAGEPIPVFDDLDEEAAAWVAARAPT